MNILKSSRNFLACITLLLCFESASACDPCALYNASRLLTPTSKYSLGITNQFTNFERGGSKRNSRSGDENFKDEESERSFNTTNLNFGYEPSKALDLQLTTPINYRRYDVARSNSFTTDSESGLGDIILGGTFKPFIESSESSFFGLTFGIKLPTGDTGSLAEDVSGDEVRKHHVVSSGASGGRVLSLGTGSVDFIGGVSHLFRQDRFLLLSQAQYTLRTEGSYDYRFADDILFRTGPGMFVYLDHDVSGGVKATFSAERKGLDKQNGELVKGSRVENYYVGPEAFLLIGEQLTLESGIDFRVGGSDKDSEVVPDHRLRSGLTWRF